MTLRDFYKDHYYHEIRQRHELTNALGLPLGVFTLLVGGLSVMVKEIAVPFDWIEVVQLALIVISALLLLTTAYFFVRSYFNYEYGYIATAKEIKDYRDLLLAYYVAQGNSPHDASQTAERETLDYIDAEYARYAEKNAANNGRKSSFLHKANYALILAILSAGISAVPYVISSVNAPRNIYKVEITNLKEAPMAEQNSDTPKTTQEQQPAGQEKVRGTLPTYAV